MSERPYWFWVLPELLPAPVRRPAPSEIVCEVAAKHGLTMAQIKGPGRARYLSRPRQEAMYELRQRTRLSLPQIARHLGREDHTTALHGVRAHSKRLAEQAATA